MSKHFKIVIVITVMATAVVIYLVTRAPAAEARSPDSNFDNLAAAKASTRETKARSPQDSAVLTSKEMVAGLSGDERDTVAKMSDDVRPLYVVGWYYLHHPTSDATTLDSIVSAAERSLLVTPKNSPKLFENAFAPEHAGFALAVLTHMWYIRGPIVGLEDRITTQAIRFADCPENDVVRAAAASMLHVMEERPSGRGLSVAGKATLKRLLANDYIRHLAETQRKDIDEAKQKAEGK